MGVVIFLHYECPPKHKRRPEPPVREVRTAYLARKGSEKGMLTGTIDSDVFERFRQAKSFRGG
jgi:hypothetical protein